MKQVLLGKQHTRHTGNGFAAVRDDDWLDAGFGTQAFAEAKAACPWAVPGTFSGLGIRGNGASAGSLPVTLRKNGADSALTVTVTTGGTLVTDITHTVSVAAQDLVNLRVTASMGDPDMPWWSALTFEADEAGVSVYPLPDFRNGFDQSTTYYRPIWNHNGGWLGTISRVSPVALPGSIIRYALNLETAPGTGKSRVFALYKLVAGIWVIQDGSGGSSGTVDTRHTITGSTTSAIVTLDYPTTGGDLLVLGQAPSGNPAATAYATGSVAFRATDVTKYMIAGDSGHNAGEPIPVYSTLAITFAKDVFGAESGRVNYVGPDSLTLFGLHIYRTTAPGSGLSITYGLRQNGAAASPTVQAVLTDTNQFASDASGHEVTAVQGDTLDLAFIASSGLIAAGGEAWTFGVVDPAIIESPEIETRPATNIGRTSATLQGRINPHGTGILLGHFEWGLAASPDNLTEVTGTRTIPNGSVWVPYSIVITGLTPGTTYEFRAVDDFGDVGLVLSFTTPDEPEFSDGTSSHPILMREFVDRQGVSHVAAEVDLNDPGPATYGGTGYEHGYKAARILEAGEITRGLSDYQGQIEHLAYSLREEDTDYFWRGLLAEPPGGGSPVSRRYLTQRPLILKIIDDEDRRALKPWRIAANGYISDYTALPNLQFSLTGTDWIKKRFSRSFRAQYAWQRLVSTIDFAEADGSVTTADGVSKPVAAVGKGVPSPAYGKVSDEDAATPKGAYRPLWAGPIVIGGTTYQIGIIAGHAIAALRQGFLHDVEVDLTSDPDWLTYRNAAAWAAAGFTDPFVDLNGRRYSLIFLKGDAGDALAGLVTLPVGSVGVTINFWGVENVGDSTGDVITHPVLQHKHFAMNYLAPPTPTEGDWLAVSPLFETLPGLPLVDEASFDAMAALVNDRLPSGEYESAGVVGANGDLVSAEDVLAWFNLIAYTESGCYTRYGQYAITAEPAAPVGGEQIIDEKFSVVADSLSLPEQVTSQFWNVLPFVHTRDYPGRRSDGWVSPDVSRTYLTFLVTQTEVRDDTSIANYEQEMKSQRFELQFGWAYTTQGALTIVDSMVRRLNSYTNPRRNVIFAGPFSLLSIEPGVVFKLTTIEGIDVGGWTNHYVRAVRHKTNASQGRVGLECYDIGLVWGFL